MHCTCSRSQYSRICRELARIYGVETCIVYRAALVANCHNTYGHRARFLNRTTCPLYCTTCWCCYALCFNLGLHGWCCDDQFMLFDHIIICAVVMVIATAHVLYRAMLQPSCTMQRCVFVIEYDRSTIRVNLSYVPLHVHSSLEFSIYSMGHRSIIRTTRATRCQ